MPDREWCLREERDAEKPDARFSVDGNKTVPAAIAVQFLCRRKYRKWCKLIKCPIAQIWEGRYEYQG